MDFWVPYFPGRTAGDLSSDVLIDSDHFRPSQVLQDQNRFCCAD